MIRQFLEIKEQVPDCILFFRMGDFYEMFFEDAEIASRVLSIALTSRDKGKPDAIPMCGVPFRAVDAYLSQMVDAGYKVAICDQAEDPKKAKGLVKREITKVVTPGMRTDSEHLPARDHLFLCALAPGRDEIGLASLDLASGEFKAAALAPGPPVADELARVNPAELVLPEKQMNPKALSGLGVEGIEIPQSAFSGKPPSFNQAVDILGERLPAELSGAPEAAVIAAAMAWSTVVATQRREPGHVEALRLYRPEGHLVLDAGARRNLELFRSIASGSRKGSLIQAMDRTGTAMGARLLGQWLSFPLMELDRIESRHQAVGELCASPLVLEALADLLKALPDVPRLVGRAGLGQATPRDLASLRDALELLPRLIQETAALNSPFIAERAVRLEGLEDLQEDLAKSLCESPPVNLAEGGVIAEGVSEELDRQRSLKKEGKGWIAGLQAGLRTDHGIPSLKVGFNKVFGYYIEVTRAHLAKVPDEFIRKQTLANAERFITPELKERESEVLGAEEKALALERDLFEQLRDRVAAWSGPLMSCARALAALDVLCGLASLALSRGYVRPHMSQDGPLEIIGGRHPVVESMLAEGEFVPNDVRLDDEEQVLIITGPNMAGKSTILRQVALISLLAQAGSFVPAKSAELPLVDRVFTRVGAMDDLARGRSTFMVEMTETSQILKQATPNSLVILDEVGRGTSTFDGLSLAWAVAEYLHDLAGKGVKTLFATHYHELTELAADRSRVRNFNVAVKEYKGGIVFLRKLKPGGVSRSYGLQVARLAGLPEEVLARARDILHRLEQGGLAGNLSPAAQPKAASTAQLPLFQPPEHPVLTRLKEMDLSGVTPLQALNLLDELQRDLS